MPEPHQLFANTGVQIICIPFPPSVRISTEQVGYGWQYCRCQSGTEVRSLDFLQWQIVRGTNRLFLAVDTTVAEGDVDVGYCAKASSLEKDVAVRVERLLGINGKPIEGLAPVDLSIRPATAEGGDPKDVDMIIDFGNSRTGALLMEMRNNKPLFVPLQLVNRFHLDSWDEHGEITRNSGARWFSSKSYWCTPPYREPPQLSTVVYDTEVVTDLFGRKKEVQRPRDVAIVPQTFQELSMVRLGREADELSLVMTADGENRIGVSSPKRYLWAHDAGWLEGANWYMADPFGKFDANRRVAKLQGPLLRFFPENDEPDVPELRFDAALHKPRHAPRLLMTGALYEMLCQAYSFINSPTYRRDAGERDRMRRLRSVTMTYPSGMIAVERQRLDKQARKAIHVFSQTAGRMQPAPEFHLSVDEASAVHLTYIWSEVQKLGSSPKLWFELMGRLPEPPAAETPETPPVAVTSPADRRRDESRARREIRHPRPAVAAAPPALPEVRVACIDIGGGTSDLMIARYKCDVHTGGYRVLGETLHRDGISVAGDQLVKRLLERIIVPHFAAVLGLDDKDALRLFGPEIVGYNSHIRAQRIHWINRLLVPLAQAYLERAAHESTGDEVSHLDPEIVASEVVDSLQATINNVWRVGEYNVKQPLGLHYDPDEFTDVVHEVFYDLIRDFCESIVEHQADVVLLAGLPTKLGYIQDLVRTSLPLAPSRIIPMYHRYVGDWYPYQNPDMMNPGVIVDPKSAVVVGAAVEFAAKHGMLSQFIFRMSDVAAQRSYFWGVMTESCIKAPSLIFRAAEDSRRTVSEEQTLALEHQRLVIGRKRREYENAQASPVYVLLANPRGRIGEIKVDVTLRRFVGRENEEQLEVVRVDGTVAGQPAVLGENVLFEWRTLLDERYYLDTGGLDKIELGT